MIYLDSAATSLLKPLAVEQAMLRALRGMASPGRGAHAPAMLAAETVLDCREEAAALFHVPDPERVVFTSNATHALNIAIRSLVKPGARVVLSGFEHNAVTRPLHALGAEMRVAGRRLFDPEALLADFARLLPGADAAVCTQVSNVFGYALPIEGVAELCKLHHVPLIVDASQAAGVLDVDMARWGAAFIAMPGHKGLLGPQGTGLLLCGETGEPLIYGGSGSESRRQDMPEELPERLEAGTHNVCGIAGLLAGIRYVRERGTAAILAHERMLLDMLCAELTGSGLELFTGPGQTGVLSLRFPQLDCESAAQRLAEHGICVRSGLHCAPLAHESAGTLETGTVRLSVSPFLSEGQIRESARILRNLAR
ncbi:MAG: aminotransferase class V-fold PLP-dependent enzyme [Eubacteriales bacterium]|nr:aminotransferase class V-fold PLP-dependent enzyme [Eubacteriales bacterium]